MGGLRGQESPGRTRCSDRSRERLCEKLRARVGIEAEMTRFRASLVAVLLGLSLTVPVVAACSDCCPQGQAQPTVVAPPACCGECAPTLEKRDSATSLAAKRVTVDPGPISLAEDPVVHLPRNDAFEPVVPATPSLRPCPRPSPLQLRL
jgi:hypothetical protein